MNICSIPGCAEPYKARGLCQLHYVWAKKNNVVLPPMRSTSFRLGLWAESKIAKLLSDAGRIVERQKTGAPFDMLVDGWRVDVKCSEPHKQRDGIGWQARIRETPCNTDIYIIRLEQFLGTIPRHLLLRAPLRVKGLCIPKSTVDQKYEVAFEDYASFVRGDFGKRPS